MIGSTWLTRRINTLRQATRTRQRLKALASQMAGFAADLPASGFERHANRLLILPSDPWSLVGAKGDDAMLSAVAARFRERHPDGQVAVATATESADEAARLLGLTPLPLWREPWQLPVLWAAVQEFAPAHLLVVGADIMDGYYNPLTTARLLSVADLGSRAGMNVDVLGFSFNAEPERLLRPVFNRCHERLGFNVRDTISLARFQAFCDRPARLVADVAFLLPPSPDAVGVQGAIRWARQRRDLGQGVIGINVHPMLIRDRDPLKIAALTSAMTGALDRLLAERPLSVMLINHDSRGQDGDDVCLEPVAEVLRSKYPDAVLFPRDLPRAAQIKAVVGHVDGVVTGRMHLAIAALGMGTPVAALTYQDKFQGLFRHFDLPEHLLLPPDRAVSVEEMTVLLRRFCDELPALRASVAAKLPTVKALSQLNIERCVAA